VTDLSDLPLRDDLRALSPYGAPQIDVAVRLNTNENPHPPSAILLGDLAAALTAELPGLGRYPDREATALRADLATYVGVDPEMVWAANGSNEVLQQLLQAFGGPGRTALGFEPSYSMHHLISLATSTGWDTAVRAADFSLDAERAVDAVARVRPDVVFLCTPNNPTGTSIAPDVVAAVYDATDGIVVVDEAYAEFSAQASCIELLAGRPRLVVTRTMSKAFAFAGTRLGYLVADPAVVDAMRLVRLPYHLSALTQAAARTALSHLADLRPTVESIISERARVVAALDELGIHSVPSDANFVLFPTPSEPRDTWQALLDRGVLIRDVSGAVPGHLRVTIGLPAENDAFLAALRGVLEESS
jgi:histidinol-phosphate aminotransferase